MPCARRRGVAWQQVGWYPLRVVENDGCTGSVRGIHRVASKGWLAC